MGKILCFMPNDFADFEITLTLHLLKELGGRQVASVGYTRDPVVAQSGLTYMPDMVFGDIQSIDDIEGMILPGGPIRENLADLTNFILRMYGRRKMLAAICYAPQYLGRSGLLGDHRYTTSCPPDHIARIGAINPYPRYTYVNERVVADGCVITAKGNAFVDFAFAILHYLGVYSNKGAELDEFYHCVTDK